MLEVYDGVPVPEINRRPKTGRRKYPVETMTVGQMFFEPGRTAKSMSAYISRITKDLPGKFTARHCCVLMQDGKPVEVPPGTDGAIEGAGVWRLE